MTYDEPEVRLRLLFARHGESQANVDRVIANRDSVHPLTATGRAQARALAEAVRSEGVARVISSPIQRAMETSALVGEALGVPVEVSAALREPDCGIYEGRSDDAAWLAHEEIQRAWLEDGRVDACLDGGESLVDLRARFIPFIARLVATDGDRGTTVLLVGHGSLYRCLLPEVMVGFDPGLARRRYLDHAQYMIAAPGPDGRLTWLGISPPVRR